jgi:hypothetical protein
MKPWPPPKAGRLSDRRRPPETSFPTAFQHFVFPDGSLGVVWVGIQVRQGGFASRNEPTLRLLRAVAVSCGGGGDPRRFDQRF